MPSLAERDRRYAALRESMRTEGLDYLLLVADAHHKGNVRYLTDHDIWSLNGYVLLPLDDEPTLITSMRSQQYWARERGWVSDIHSAQHPIQEAINLLRARVSRGSERLGIGGLADLMSVGDFQQLRDALPELEAVDATRLVMKVRALKSDEELVGFHESSLIADEGFRLFEELARPGLSEREAIAEVERLVRSRGVRDTLFLMSPGPYLREPSSREFQAGDLLMLSVELAGPSGYWVELGGVLSFGQPSPADERLFRCCQATFERGVELLKPGSTGADVAAALGESLQAWGYEAGIWGGHGIGLDVAEQPRLVASDSSPLEVGMAFGFHPHVIDEATNRGAYLADTLLVAELGGAGLSGLSRELRIVRSWRRP